MRFLTISSKIYVSAAVFYSTFSLSKCRAGDIPEPPWRHDDEIVHIYRTEVPWIPIEFENRRNNFAFVAWVTVLSVVVSVAFIVCLCCVCWRLCPKLNSRRQSSNAALMPSAPEAIVVFQRDAQAEIDGRSRTSTTTSNIYGRGVVNFAFTSSLQDPVPNLPTGDGPPEYSAVISQVLPSDRPTNNAPYPLVSGTKTVETPPPAYMSVGPFQ